MPVPKQPSTFAEKMKNAPVPGRRRATPLWKGPEADGITFSMLSRFLVCRERFRLHVMEGLRPTHQFNHRIEYGQMWHLCEEFHAQGQEYEGALKTYANTLCREYPTAQDQVMKWLRICLIQFPMYLRYWEDHPDMGLDHQPLLSEFVFSIPYHLPSGRTVLLRGKWDSVDLAGQGVQRGIWLQENKTKGDIDPLQIQRQLSFDLQTMMYLAALYEVHDDSEMPEGFDYPVRGVRYNVVRRPLSGGKGSIVQKKGSKNVPPETDDEYYARLGAYIEAEPETYFMRWNVNITKEDVQRFRHRCLTPLLEQIVTWYDWVAGDKSYGRSPFSDLNSLHWQHPFGVFNVLDEGGSSDLDEYLATGNEVGLERTERLFTELEG